jgi:peroxiredoxin
MSVILFGILLPWLFVGFGCWLGYQLLRQNGRLLLRLEALEQRLSQLPAVAPSLRPPVAPSPEGLPLGSVAPDFELPDLAGGRKALADFRGRRLLLIFFNPQCGFCTQMARDLAALPTDQADGRPVPLVITTGSAEENRKLVAQHGIPCPVLLVTSRRKGGRIPGFAWPLLQRPAVLVALYGLFLLVLLFHGLFLLRQGPLPGPAPAG